MLWISILLMIPFWIFLVMVSLMVLTERVSWDAKHIAVAAFLSITVVLLIPFQLMRYFRELRGLRALKRDV
jgi:hypothetical protein